MTAFVADRSKLQDSRGASWVEDLLFDEAVALHKDPTLASTFKAANRQELSSSFEKLLASREGDRSRPRAMRTASPYRSSSFSPLAARRPPVCRHVRDVAFVDPDVF
jgi:hypothetical protein